MPYKDVKFGRTLQALGRNGTTQCHGVEVMRYGNGSISISPITSRGYVGRCRIEIPMESVRDVSEAMNQCVADGEKEGI